MCVSEACTLTLSHGVVSSELTILSLVDTPRVVTGCRCGCGLVGRTDVGNLEGHDVGVLSCESESNEPHSCVLHCSVWVAGSWGWRGD